jgi:hypothetical protein
MKSKPVLDDGPTPERIQRAAGFVSIVGRSRSTRRITMQDDALGRAWLRKDITAEEYSALRKYAWHWFSAGLSGHVRTIDFNRVQSSGTGLTGSEARADHLRLYGLARERIGTRPALVADHVACFDMPLDVVGSLLGYRSRWHGRVKAREILSDAGYRLGQYWQELAKRR